LPVAECAEPQVKADVVMANVWFGGVDRRRQSPVVALDSESWPGRRGRGRRPVV